MDTDCNLLTQDPRIQSVDALIAELQLELKDGAYNQSLLILDELVYKVILLYANQAIPGGFVYTLVSDLESSFERGHLTQFRKTRLMLEKLMGQENANHIVAFVLSHAG
jgi:hypothetical protein